MLRLHGKTIMVANRFMFGRFQRGILGCLCHGEVELIRRFHNIHRARSALAGRLARAVAEDDQQVLAGCCFLARSVEHYLIALILLKRTQGQKAWSNLIDAEERLRSATRFPLFLQDEVLLQKQFVRIEGLLGSCFPQPIMNFSPGFELGKKMCSICGKPLVDCTHTVGLMYEGKICTASASDLKIREMSIVEEPRNRRAVVVTMNHGGKSLDVYAGSTVPSKEPEANRETPNCRAILMTASLSNDIVSWESLEPMLLAD